MKAGGLQIRSLRRWTGGCVGATGASPEDVLGEPEQIPEIAPQPALRDQRVEDAHGRNGDARPEAPHADGIRVDGVTEALRRMWYRNWKVRVAHNLERHPMALSPRARSWRRGVGIEPTTSRKARRQF